MTTNRLAKPANAMTAARAEKFARWASERGDGEKARLWHEYAAELAKAERTAE